MSSAFYNCSSLESIEIPEGITMIDDDTFRYCTNLTSIKLPSTLTTIESSAFYDCNNLKEVYFNNTFEKWLSISKSSSNYG